MKIKLTKLNVLTAAFGLLAGYGSTLEAQTIGTRLGTNTMHANDSSLVSNASYREAIIYYKRDDNSYDEWGLHLWNSSSCDSISDALISDINWSRPLPSQDIDSSNGARFVVPLKSGHNSCMNFILHKGEDKALGNQDLQLEFDKGNTLYTQHGSPILNYSPDHPLSVRLDGAAAHWLDLNSIAWFDHSKAVSYQIWSNESGLSDISHPQDFTKYDMVVGELIDKPKFPHLKGRTGFELTVSPERAKDQNPIDCGCA